MRPLLIAAAVSLLMACQPSADGVDDPLCAAEGAALYERRIEPVLSDDRPKTCNQCHLSGVDLGIFVRDTPCETMACLVELELVDLEAPEESRILSWISRAVPDSALITDEVIAAEHDAFQEWIEHTASCGGLGMCANVDCGPSPPSSDCSLRGDDEEVTAFELDPSDCSTLAREETFLNTVYPYRGRCFPCHYLGSEYVAEGAPRWIDGSDSCGPSALNSLTNLLELGVVDFENPELSLLLLKPLSERMGGVEHGGHDKFEDIYDPAYVAFLEWIEYEKGCRE